LFSSRCSALFIKSKFFFSPAGFVGEENGLSALHGTCHLPPGDQANIDPQILLEGPSFNRFAA
jgi:hypothetical protein